MRLRVVKCVKQPSTKLVELIGHLDLQCYNVYCNVSFHFSHLRKLPAEEEKMLKYTFAFAEILEHDCLYQPRNGWYVRIDPLCERGCITRVELSYSRAQRAILSAAAARLWLPMHAPAECRCHPKFRCQARAKICRVIRMCLAVTRDQMQFSFGIHGRRLQTDAIWRII